MLHRCDMRRRCDPLRWLLHPLHGTRRCGVRWRGRCGARRRGRRRRRGVLRCHRGRLARGRRALWRREFFSIGMAFAGGLRHHHRCGLGLRWRKSEWHRRKSCRGKQHETKVGHDDLGPRKNNWRQREVLSGQTSSSGNQRISVRPDCGSLPGGRVFISENKGFRCVLVHCAFRRWFQIVVHVVPCGIFHPAIFTPRPWGRAWALAALAPAVRRASCPAIPPGVPARPDRASAAVPRAADCPADSLAAAPTAVPA